jgi:DNA (cytosine-5)-methyltransferase 1
MGVQEFVQIADEHLPPELFDLDILDGSPPCSAFSKAGHREEKWGGNFHFREGQAVQRLDDLFFDFIDVAAKLKPKVVVAENVKGLVLGNAKGYVKQIFGRFKEAGYDTRLFLVNAAAMGVPQRRVRTIFVAVRRDLGRTVGLSFDEAPISAGDALAGIVLNAQEILSTKPSKMDQLFWPGTKVGSSYEEECRRIRGKSAYFNSFRLDSRKPVPTLTSYTYTLLHWSELRKFCERELSRFQTFPEDFNFLDARPGYLIGMSVPPFMMQRIALEVCRQVFDIEYDQTIINGYKKCAVRNPSPPISRSLPEIPASVR